MYSTRENINYKHIIYNIMFINCLFKFMKTKQKYKTFTSSNYRNSSEVQDNLLLSHILEETQILIRENSLIKVIY